MTENKTQDPSYFDDVIDLQELVKTLLKYKWIIIAATLLAAIGVFATSKFLLPPQYEASAQIGITQPSFEVDLEPSINNLSPLDDYRIFIESTKSLPDLAEVVEVWLSVCEELNLTCLGEGNDKPNLEATLIGTNQLKLTVTSINPERSAEFANLWAEEVTKRWNILFSRENIDIFQLEGEVTQALEYFNVAQKRLEEYLPKSQLNVVEVQLNQAKGKLARYLMEIESNESIIRDAASFDARLGGQNQSDKLLIGDALSLVGLLQRTTGEVSGTQFQITGTDIYGQEFTISEARQTLTDLISALENQNETLKIQLDGLEVEINTLVLEQESEQFQITLLKQERDRTQNKYQALSRYLDETMIDIEYSTQAAFCVAKAVIPQIAESNTLMNTALAGMVGLMLATGGVLVFAWWTSEEESN